MMLRVCHSPTMWAGTTQTSRVSLSCTAILRYSLGDKIGTTIFLGSNIGVQYWETMLEWQYRAGEDNRLRGVVSSGVELWPCNARTYAAQQPFLI